MNHKLIFRSYKSKDANNVLNIYNFYIENGLSNFEEKKLTLKQFVNFSNEIIQLNLPFVVCEKNSLVVGFAFLNKFRNKSGYKYSFENSIYIDKDYTGIGIGSKLLKNLINTAKKNPKIKNIIAVIGNESSQRSIKLPKKNGFNIVGTLKKVGYKKKQWLDAIYMQKIIDEKD